MKNVPNKWLRLFVPVLLILIWLGISGVGGPYFGKIEEVSEVDLTAFLPESADATKVSKKIGAFLPSDTLSAIIVLERKDGEVLGNSQKIQINDASEKLSNVEGIVGSVGEPQFAEDGKASIVIANVDTDIGLETVVSDIRDELKTTKLDGIDYKVTGPAGFAADLNVAFSGIDGVLLLTALSVVFVILIVVYRSVLLPIIVLLTSIFALSASILIVFNLAKLGVIELNGQVQGILFILVIGAATDYSLLYVSRYREALYESGHRWDATVGAFKGAFEPILASGGTVIVGLLCLLISDLASNKALGPVGSIGILMAMLSALTFLPSALLLAGRKAFWPVVPRATLEAQQKHKKKIERGLWHNVGELVNRRPRVLWITSGLVLLVFASFSLQIKADGVPQSDLIIGYSEARDGQKTLGEHFPNGSGSPALVIVKENLTDETVEAIDSTKGVDKVSITANGVAAGFAPIGQSQRDIDDVIKARVDASRRVLPAELLAELPSSEQQVEQAYPFKDAEPLVKDGEVLLQVTLDDDPDSEAAKDTINSLRVNLDTAGIGALVGGTTAAQLDTTTASIRDRAVIIPIVLVAITIILAFLLRAIVAPIILLATTVLSFASSIGVSALLFNNILGFPGADPSVLLYGFVFLVALGIDYNIFLMTRVREESLKSGTSKGVIKGLVVTGGVITSAGVVLAATFAALGVIPILFLFQLAFIVAFGVLLDTLVIRSILVPALIKDIGSFIWWPSKVK